MSGNFWRGYRIGLIVSIPLWVLIILFIATVASAQERIVTPLDCLPTLDGMAPYAELPGLPFDTSGPGLATMSGRAIWLGYNGEHGPGEWQRVYWDMPDDVRPVLIIVPMAGLGVYNDHRWIMVYLSPTVPGRIWLMANAKAPYDSQGHEGYHPCGAAELVLERVGDAPSMERF